jgi:DNA-binding PadR family transcriptional regulator
MTSMNPPLGPSWGFRRHRRPRPPFGPDMMRMAPSFEEDPADEGPGPRGHRGPGPRHHHRPFPPFGPGFGPGFPPRGRGRGRGRRTSRGDVRAAVLALVAEQPRHGYEIIQEITDRSGGAWRPSPGSVYPTLSQLEDEGLVAVEKAEGRRVVRLTDAGTAYVAEHRAELDAVWESVGRRDDDEGATQLWEQLSQLHAATHQVMQAGTPEQIAAASTALADARKAIYRLLAE